MKVPIAGERRCHPLAGLRAGPMRRDRGDVPGWVLIAVMTAGLVTVLWAVAGPRLTSMLEQALDSVVGP